MCGQTKYVDDLTTERIFVSQTTCVIDALGLSFPHVIQARVF